VRSYRELALDPRLHGWVRCAWTSNVGAGDDASHPVLPDGCIDLLFVRQTGALRVVGTMTETQWVSGCGPADFVAVRLRPGGASALLGLPADALTDLDPRAEDALGPAGAELERRLQDGAGLERLEAFLRRRAADAPPVDPRVARVARALRREPSTKVGALAADLGVSRQYLRRLVRAHVGVTPKVLARIARLERVVPHLGGPLARAAADAGYADQAHLSREFRALVGVSPSRFPFVQDGAPPAG